MKKLSILCLLLSTSATHAADMPVKATPMLIPSWAPTLSAYTFFDFGSYRSEFPGREFRASFYQGLFGLNYTVTPEWTVGGGIIYGNVHADLNYLGSGAFSDTDSATGFLTTAYSIPNLFTIGGSGGYGKSWTHQERFVFGVRSLADYGGDNWFASGYVTRTFQAGNFYLTPVVRVLARESESDAYLESTGLFTQAERSTSLQLDYGGQISYAIPAGGGWVLYPTAQIHGMHFFRLPLYQASRDGLDLKLGLSATVGNWSIGAAYMTIFGLDSYSDFHAGRLFLSYNFGGPRAPEPAPIWRGDDRPISMSR